MVYGLPYIQQSMLKVVSQRKRKIFWYIMFEFEKYSITW